MTYLEALFLGALTPALIAVLNVWDARKGRGKR